MGGGGARAARARALAHLLLLEIVLEIVEVLHVLLAQCADLAEPARARHMRMRMAGRRVARQHGRGACGGARGGGVCGGGGEEPGRLAHQPEELRNARLA